MTTIEILYFEDCPSWKTALENLEQAIKAENLHCQVRLIKISTPQQAQDECFLGSPSFRMNGVDFWPEQPSRYNMSCRVYQTDQGMHGSPTVEMLRAQIRDRINK